jgi:hypothetical protein
LGDLWGRCDITALLHSIATYSRDDTITVTVTPASGYGTRVNVGLVSTQTLTASASGGTAPYTYLWEIIDGSDAYASAPNSAATQIREDVLLAPVSYDRTARVTATDANGSTGSRNVSCILEVESFA